MGQDGINKRVLNICRQEIQGYESLFKETFLNLKSWIPYRDKDGWQLQGEELKIAKLYGKWEGMAEVNKPNLVIVVPRLRGYILALGILKK